jgi:hypothetical protein
MAKFSNNSGYPSPDSNSVHSGYEAGSYPLDRYLGHMLSRQEVLDCVESVLPLKFITVS